MAKMKEREQKTGRIVAENGRSNESSTVVTWKASKTGKVDLFLPGTRQKWVYQL